MSCVSWKPRHKWVKHPTNRTTKWSTMECPRSLHASEGYRYIHGTLCRTQWFHSDRLKWRIERIRNPRSQSFYLYPDFSILGHCLLFLALECSLSFTQLTIRMANPLSAVRGSPRSATIALDRILCDSTLLCRWEGCSRVWPRWACADKWRWFSHIKGSQLEKQLSGIPLFALLHKCHSKGVQAGNFACYFR